MEWNRITTLDDLETLKIESLEQPVFIFKHSTRCAISSMVINRMERSWNDGEMDNVKAYYLDLISYRDISNKVAEMFGVYHQSPQLLVIQEGRCVYDNSHMGISYGELLEVVKG